ncbi:MAG TPA: rRNA maturation RNase YbeY [Treponemataceae bacterium]|nr:rRNA maturation RNase YbeY [Treponemataceae bacterium]
MNRIIVDSQEGIERPGWIENVEPFIALILDKLGIENWELSVLFCNDAFITDLNKKYRDIDSPTDVLSFEQGDEYIDDEDVNWFNAGDIVISLDTLKSNAKDFSVDVNDELKRLLVHGVLHLDGMDHEDNSPEQEMLQFQEHLLAGFKNILVYGDN